MMENNVFCLPKQLTFDIVVRLTEKSPANYTNLSSDSASMFQ